MGSDWDVLGCTPKRGLWRGRDGVWDNQLESVHRMCSTCMCFVLVVVVETRTRVPAPLTRPTVRITGGPT